MSVNPSDYGMTWRGPLHCVRYERQFLFGLVRQAGFQVDEFGCFRHQLLLPRPYLILTKPLRLDIRCQRAASVKIGWKYLDD